jgi:hypothetical protein
MSQATTCLCGWHCVKILACCSTLPIVTRHAHLVPSLTFGRSWSRLSLESGDFNKLKESQEYLEYSQSSSSRKQCAHNGLSSVHFRRLCLQLRHPFLERFLLLKISY